ncbi:MAG: Na+/H+ antiporter subunit E [Desulfobacterales bacterium]|nr:Na+/H+ antiporter subunit E [Desulfobacterales bacterium]
MDTPVHTSDRKGPLEQGHHRDRTFSKNLRRSKAGISISFIVMFSTWLIFSGKFDGFHVAMGVISSGIVALISSDLFFPSPPNRFLPVVWLRFAGYIPWLLYQIFLANLHVMYLVLHPRMRDLINPQIIEFDSKLSSDVARTTFANSITLTPGTITVHVTAAGKFSVHCIDAESGKPLPGKMEAKIAQIFGE